MFIFDKLSRKCINIVTYQSVKLIKYNITWHKGRDIFDDLIDWILL